MRKWIVLPLLFSFCRISPVYGFLMDSCERTDSFRLTESTSALQIFSGDTEVTKEGITIRQTVSVRNTSPVPVYVRALILPSVENGSGREAVFGTSADWYYDPADGYYYYSGTLGSGESTSALMEGAVFENLSDEQIDAEIYVYEESMPAGIGEGAEEAWRF